jgi:DNA replicative helicase MCM subunit Mcm2 (Cdc46/Mcm family)
MAQVTISGSIKVVGKTQQVSDKFSKRELVITEPSGQRPQHIPVEFTQDRTSMLDSFKPGDEVTVTCFVNGREWQGKDGVMKYFLSLSGNRIERVGAAAPAPSGGGYQAAPPPSIADMPAAGSADDDDLPF